MQFLEQFCDFDIIKGSYYDNYELVRRIQSTPNGYGNYKDNQQCWASFKCPSDHTVYWRRVWFNTELGFWLNHIAFLTLYTDIGETVLRVAVTMSCSTGRIQKLTKNIAEITDPHQFGTLLAILKSLSNSKPMEALQEVDLKFYYDVENFDQIRFLWGSLF